MLGFMTRRFAVKREMCKNLDSRSQYLSEVLGFLEASYGMDMWKLSLKKDHGCPDALLRVSALLPWKR